MPNRDASITADSMLEPVVSRRWWKLEGGVISG
jgi:hypothetical protein